MRELASVVEKTPALGDNFYAVYDQIYPNRRTVYLGKSFLHSVQSLLKNERDVYVLYDCKCDAVYRLLAKENTLLRERGEQWKDEHKPFWFGFAIQKFTSPEKCFDYVYYDKSSKLAKKHFQKNIAELTDDEVIELLMLMESVTMYNKKRNLDVFNRKFLEMKRRVTSASDG